MSANTDPTAKDPWVRGLLGLIFMGVLAAIYTAGGWNERIVVLTNSMESQQKYQEIFGEKLGELTFSLERQSAALGALTGQVIKLIENDMTDIRQRLLTVESKQIIPKAEAQIAELKDEILHLKESIQRLEESP